MTESTAEQGQAIYLALDPQKKKIKYCFTFDLFFAVQQLSAVFYARISSRK